MTTAAELAHSQAIEAGHWMLFRRKFRPPDDQVFKAKKSIQKAFGNRTRGLSIPQTALSEELSGEGHGRAAIQWALFDLVRAELLLVEPPQGAKLDEGYKPGCSISAVGDAWKWTRNQLKKEFDPNETSPLVVPPREGQLTVARWDDLGIGIHPSGKYLGISRPLDNNAVFPIESATELHLPGQQWKVLMDLFAKSDIGNSAKKSDVLNGLGKLNREVFARIANSDNVDVDCLTEIQNTAFRKLTGIVGNLARKLRKQVKGPEDKRASAVLSVASEDCVQSAFVVRYLVQEGDGKLHFGEKRANPRQPIRRISR